MKSQIIFFIIIMSVRGLMGLTIPYSETELQSETNHLNGFRRISPDDSLAIPLAADVWLWYDSNNLYVLSECEIDENFEKGRLGSDDEWVDCDFIRIQIITDLKNYYSYMFYSFPLENKYDCVRNSSMQTDANWNSDYKSESTYSGNIWKSKLTIPFKDLRFWGKPPYNWKIILTRYIYNNESYYSFPYGTIEMGSDYFRTAYDIEIENEIAKNRNYKITPYFVKKYDLETKEESFDPDNVGLDFSYNPTTATKLKLSLNPDFSDIPMDNLEDNFNIRYEPNFNENRFFFIEDLNVFGVDSNVFYTRHIRQPEFALKLTGNSEHFSYGFLTAKDKEVVENGEVIHYGDAYNLLSFRPKWKNLFIQMTLLNKINEDNHNEVLFLNPHWEFLPSQTVWSKIELSYKSADEMEDKKGYTISCGYNGQKNDYEWELTLTHCSKDYYADMGRVFEWDYSAADMSITYDSEPDGALLKNFGNCLWGHKTIDNTTHDLISQNGGYNLWMTFQQKFNWYLNYHLGQESFFEKIYDMQEVWTSCSYYQLNWLKMSISYSIGEGLIYSEAMNADQDHVNYSLYGDISDFISYQLAAQRKRYFELPDSCGIDDNYWIGNADLTFNFTNEFSITNGLRYSDYESEWTTSYLGIFVNLSYEFRDNCFLYLGYKTVQDEIEEEYIVDYRQAYLKLRYTF